MKPIPSKPKAGLLTTAEPSFIIPRFMVFPHLRFDFNDSKSINLSSVFKSTTPREAFNRGFTIFSCNICYFKVCSASHFNIVTTPVYPKCLRRSCLHICSHILSSKYSTDFSGLYCWDLQYWCWVHRYHYFIWNKNWLTVFQLCNL
jgi:hypothetical protein